MYVSPLIPNSTHVNLSDADLVFSGIPSTRDSGDMLLGFEPSLWTRVFSVPGGKLIVEGEGEEPPWFMPTVQALVELLYLPKDWDSYGAWPINPEAVRSALQLLSETMRADTPAPTVVPTNRRSVQLEWHTWGIDLEIELQSPGHIHVSYEDQRSEDEWEIDLTSDLTQLSDAISELSRRS
jgi:hypothetical protein